MPDWKSIMQIMAAEDDEIFKILDDLANNCKHEIRFEECFDVECRKIQSERLTKEVLDK